MLDPSIMIIITISLTCVALVKFFTYKSKPPIFNIYRTPGRNYWLKVIFMFLILTLRKVVGKIKDEVNKHQHKPDKFETIDRPQKLSKDKQAIDAVFFNAADQNGNHFIIATARRQNKLIDGFFYLKIEDSNVGLLESPKLPSTALYQTEETNGYSAEGFDISVVEPMKKWRLRYNGKMKRASNVSQTVDVDVDVTWTSTLPFFNVDTDMDALLMAKCTALENWSRDYFETLQKVHQTHYEHYGEISGVATINNTKHEISMSCLRDHSFGYKREWRNFHRYVLHFISVRNGDRITIGVISTPISFSRLIMGFLYSATDKKIYPVQSCDLMLHQHGEDGAPPTNYSFSFNAGNGSYIVNVHVKDAPYFYISKDWEAKIFETLCDFSVNGLKAWGATEWQYRNTDGKYVFDNKNNK